VFIILECKTVTSNLLNTVNMIKVMCTLKFLLLAHVEVVVKFLSGYKRKYRDNVTGSSSDNEASSRERNGM